MGLAAKHHKLISLKRGLLRSGRNKAILVGLLALTAMVGIFVVRVSLAATAVVTINDNTTGTANGQWEYTGSGWAYYSGEPAKFEGDDHSSGTAGDIATLRFNGTKVAYFGARSPQAGIIAVSIDGGAETQIDLYSATRVDNTSLYVSSTLALTNHTLRIRLTGNKNPSASQAAAAVDRADVTTDTAPALPWDINQNGTVDIFDLSILLGQWGKTGSGDFNTDGTVNVFDLSLLLTNWGKTAPVATPTPVPTPTPTPTPGGGTTGTAPMAYPAKAVAMYYMMWSESNMPRLSSIDSHVNVINLAFAQGDPPGMVGWSTPGQATFLSDAKAMRARGVRFVISIGGGGGSANPANRQAFVNGIMAINAVTPLDGLDWDLEGPAMNAADVVWIAQELDRLRGANFAQTMAPNGSTVGQYLPVAKALQDAGLLDAYGQQFYDAPVTKEAAMGRINEAINYGIPENKITVGMMNPNDGSGPASSYWTNDTCIDYMNWFKSQRPNLKGGYYWQASVSTATDWANRVGPILLR